MHSASSTLRPYLHREISRAERDSAAMVRMSKKILRLWLWWALQQQQPPQKQRHRSQPALPLNKEGLHQDHRSSENSRESLLTHRGLGQSNHVKEVPRGFLAVYVGLELRRFVIPTSYLSMPDFRALMELMADEFGFDQHGGLQIPCEEEDFEEVLQKCSSMMHHQTKTKSKKKCT